MPNSSSQKLFLDRRIFAFFIDLTIAIPLTVYFPFSYLAYEALLISIWGMTFGKFLVGLRIVDTEKTVPDAFPAIIRAFLKSIPIFWLSIFILENRFWHETASGTFVVESIKTKKTQNIRIVLGIMWFLAFCTLVYAVIQYGDIDQRDQETFQSTQSFVKQLTPLLPASSSALLPDKKYALCIAVATAQFSSTTTKEERESVCKDYAYTTKDEAAKMLQALFEEVDKLPADKRGDWCLDNAPYLFPEEKNIHLHCVILLENWNSFWIEFKKSSNKQVETYFDPS